MDETAVPLDAGIVEPALTIPVEQFHHVPVDGRAVAVVAFVVTLPGCKVDGTENLFVEQDVTGGAPDSRVNTDSELTNVPRTFVSVEYPVERRIHPGCR